MEAPFFGEDGAHANKQECIAGAGHPPELRERAVRMVAETVAAQGGERHGVITRVALQLGVGVESPRYWVNQADGSRPPSAQAIADEELKAKMLEVHRDNYSVYGIDKCTGSRRSG